LRLPANAAPLLAAPTLFAGSAIAARLWFATSAQFNATSPAAVLIAMPQSGIVMRCCLRPGPRHRDNHAVASPSDKLTTPPPDDADGEANPPNGTRRTLFGKACVFYDGYWIRYYAPPKDTLSARKSLIEHLSRRLFHHAEPGINTPGNKLEIARENHDREQNPARKRVAAAMLAGALFNRATDIFTTVVELQLKGVAINPRDELMRQCGRYFQEALTLGQQVKHRSGHEGIDELWGEPFKVFTMPIDAFYESRYVKIAQTMRDIDNIARILSDALIFQPGFAGIDQHISNFAESAKLISETMRSESSIFDVWPRFVAASEVLEDFTPVLADPADLSARQHAEQGSRLLQDGRNLMTWLSGARVPMPKSKREFIERCEAFAREQA
jgi:hypothetical protein